MGEWERECARAKREPGHSGREPRYFREILHVRGPEFELLMGPIIARDVFTYAVRGLKRDAIHRAARMTRSFCCHKREEGQREEAGAKVCSTKGGHFELRLAPEAGDSFPDRWLDCPPNRPSPTRCPEPRETRETQRISEWLGLPFVIS